MSISVLRRLSRPALLAAGVFGLASPVDAGVTLTAGGEVNGTQLIEPCCGTWVVYRLADATNVASGLVGEFANGYWAGEIGVDLGNIVVGEELIAVVEHGTTGAEGGNSVGYYAVMNHVLDNTDPAVFDAVTMRPIPVPTASASGELAAELSWGEATEDSATDNIVGYHVHRSIDGTNYSRISDTVVTETEFTDNQFTGIAYYALSLVYRGEPLREGLALSSVSDELGDLDGDGVRNDIDPDIDGDGMSNEYEIANGLDPFDASDATLDADGDGFDNLTEARAGTSSEDANDVPMPAPNDWALYDDFSGAALTRSKWQNYGFNREVAGGKLVLSNNWISESSAGIRTRGRLVDGAITGIQVDLALTDVDLAASNADSTFLRLEGLFYTSNGSPAVGDYTGDVWAAVYLGDRGSGLEAWWEIEESTNADFTVSNTQSGVLSPPGTLSIGVEYTVSVNYDGASGFEFFVDGNSSGAQSGPVRAGDSPNRYFDLTNGLDFGDGGDGMAARSAGTFDNVYLNGSATLYDDFSSATIDPSKWAFPRMRRDIETSDGTSRIDVGGDGQMWTVTMAMDPLEAEDSLCLGASIGLLGASDLPIGTRGRSRVDGYWYNQQVEPEVGDYNGVEGNVWAQVVLEQMEDGSQRATAYVESADDANHNTWTELAWYVFSTVPETDVLYPASIELDEDAGQLIMRFADETFTYWIGTPVHPVAPGTVFKAVRARIQSGPGTMQAIADDAVYCPSNPAGVLAVSPQGHLGGEGLGDVDVLVFRVGGSTGPVSVDYATSDGSATAGADYSAVSGTLFWDDGETTVKRVPVPILTDAESGEGLEHFWFTLSNPGGGAGLGASYRTAVAIDDDSDGDGVPDMQDEFPDDPTEWRDTDGDGIGDNSDPDIDGDGIDNDWELANGLDPRDPTDALEDSDLDGYTNLEEYEAGTDPQVYASSPAAGSNASVLLVDDDDNDPDVRSIYTEALDALGLAYATWNTGNGDREPDASELSKYDAVIWMSGKARGGDFVAGPGSDGEAALDAWLDDGGCLVLSSQEYFADKGLTTFIQNALGVANISDNSGQTSVTGAGILSGMGPYVLDYGTLGNGSDTLTPGTAAVLFDGDQGIAGVSQGKAHYLAFPFEALPTPGDREAVLGAVLGACGVHPRDPSQLDFDGDGNSDLFWRNTANGRNVMWFMDGVNRTGSADTLGLNDPAWHLAGFGDFDGDSKADILWRNPGNGRNVIWFMDGATRTGSGDTVGLGDPTWELAALKDFDGDGKVDLLWRNTDNGRNVIWFMDGATRTSAGDTLGLNHPHWNLAGFGDFNGDGKTDFLWRNTDNGRNVIWLMDGLTRIGSGDTVGLNNPAWKLTGLEDFDGDSKTDLLWRNTQNGRHVMWFMDGATRTGSGDTVGLNHADWSLTGFGDYNGDGRSDFLWHNEVNGRNVMWFMDGTTRIGAGDTVTLPFNPWFPRVE